MQIVGTYTIQSHKVFEVDTTNAFEKLRHSDSMLKMEKYCNKKFVSMGLFDYLKG